MRATPFTIANEVNNGVNKARVFTPRSGLESRFPLNEASVWCFFFYAVILIGILRIHKTRGDANSPKVTTELGLNHLKVLLRPI
jgi:hypothetical protein